MPLLNSCGNYVRICFRGICVPVGQGRVEPAAAIKSQWLNSSRFPSYSPEVGEVTLQGSPPPGSDSGSRLSASWHKASGIATPEEGGVWRWHVGSSIPWAGNDTIARGWEV